MRFIFFVLLLFGYSAHAQSVTDYEHVAASQTTQVIGPQSATSATSIGDVLQRVIIVPATTGAGTVAIKDGSGTARDIFVTGTLADLKPIVVELGARSTLGAWQITTGANVSVIAVGRFK